MLSYYLGVKHIFILLVPMIFISCWKLKSFLLVATQLIRFAIINEFDHYTFLPGITDISVQVAVICLLVYSRGESINIYLEKLQQKFNEEENWRQLIEEFHEGLGLLDENGKLFYQNSALRDIFNLG